MQTWEWYYSSHLTPNKKVNNRISQNVKLFLSVWFHIKHTPTLNSTARFQHLALFSVDECECFLNANKLSLQIGVLKPAPRITVCDLLLHAFLKSLRPCLYIRTTCVASCPLQRRCPHLLPTNGPLSGWRATGQQPDARRHVRNPSVQ